MTQAYVSGWRLRAVIVSVIFAACGYLLVSVITGWRAVLGGLAAAGWGGIVFALCMSSLNYALRFARWQLYLRSMGHRVPLLEHARIYLTGFALTTTPGKAGEAIRAVFLRHHGVDYASTLAAMFSERLSDLVAILVLCLPGLDLDPRLHLLVLISAAGVMAALGLLAWPAWLGLSTTACPDAGSKSSRASRAGAACRAGGSGRAASDPLVQGRCVRPVPRPGFRAGCAGPAAARPARRRPSGCSG